MRSRVERWVEGCVYAAGAVYALLFVALATLRLLYPYEVEWNEGAILDHALRLVHHQPLYAKPTIDFAAFVYTPLYYLLVAPLAAIFTPALWQGRAVSLVATVLTAWFAGRIVFRETGRMLFAVTAATIYLAFYRETGYFYDIVRMDATAVCFVAAGMYVVLYGRRGDIFAGFLLALAYYTKQQMLLFTIPVALFLWRRDGFRAPLRMGTVFLGVSLLLAANSLSVWGQWYWYYTYQMPSAKAAHSFSWRRFLLFFPEELFRAFAIATIAIIAKWLTPRDRTRTQSDWLLLASFLTAALLGAMGLGNEGGYRNVLMPLAFVTALALPIALARLEGGVALPRLAAALVLLLQFLALSYDPTGEKMLIASSRQRAGGDTFVATLQRMPGEVFLPFHGYIGSLAGKQSHLHFMAMLDVLNMRDTQAADLQHELDSAYAHHRFHAIVLDENPAFPADSLPHYTLSGRIFQVPNVFLSRLGDGATRPQFIYTPAP